MTERVSNVQIREELEERRAYECRLTPDRALSTVDEAEQFLRDRGLLTRTSDSALPSLLEACHEELYPGMRSRSVQSPARKWEWFSEVAQRGYIVVRVHRGRNLLLAEETAALLDPICRAEIERMWEADPEWARLLDHLAAAGPSSVEDVQAELVLKPKELKSLRAPLERCGVIVARSLGADTGHRQKRTIELARWDQVYLGGGTTRELPRDCLGNLLVTAVRAAVVAPEVELKRWFSWEWYWDDALLDELVAERRLVRVEDSITAG